MKSNLSILVIAATMVMANCKKKKDPPVNEPPKNEPQELITTLRLTFTDSASKTVSTYFFKDPDGPGGDASFYGPDKNTQTDSVISLEANSTYSCSLELLDESKSPVVDISDEVNEEGADHMVFYNPASHTVLNAGNPYTIFINGVNVKIMYTDLDSGSPQRGIGLKTKWRTSSATGKHPLTVSLKHQPGMKDGSYQPGETDMEAVFKLSIN